MHLSDGSISFIASRPLNLSMGAGVMQWGCVDGTYWPCVGYQAALIAANCSLSASDCVLLLDVLDATGAVVASSHELLAPPSALTLVPSTVTVSSLNACPENACITLSATAPALYVVLTTAAQGRFSDNAFVLRGGSHGVNFTFFGPVDLSLLESTLRIEHAQMYM